MVTRDVFQLELEKRSVVQSAVNPVTGGIELTAGGEVIEVGGGGAVDATYLTALDLTTARVAGLLVAGTTYELSTGHRYLASAVNHLYPVNGSPILTRSTLTGLGDSLMYYQWSNGQVCSLSFVQWASSQLNQQFDFIANRGVGGASIQDLINTQLTPTISDSSDAVWVHVGANQISPTSPTAASIESSAVYLRTVLNALSSVKALIIVDSFQPFLFSANDRTLEIPKFNNAFASVCAEFPNVIFNDIYKSILDASSLLGDADTSNLWDSIHQNSKGAQLMGIASAKNLAGKINILPSYGVVLNGVLPNLSGTSGTKTIGSGSITGNSPTGVDVKVQSGSASVALTNKTSVFGFNRISVDAVNVGGVVSEVQVHLMDIAINNANFSSGALVQATFYFRIKSQTNITAVAAYMLRNGGSYTLAMGSSASEAPNIQFTPGPMVCTVKTAPVIFSGATTSLDVSLSLKLGAITGAANFDLLGWKLEKVAPL